MSVVPSSRYAVLETKDLVETHRLVDHEKNAEAVVAPTRGGMVTRIAIGDDDILFLDRATLRDHSQNVRGGIPVLFPIAGRLTDDRFLLDGAQVPMAQHGFARRVPWHIVATGVQDAATMTLALEHSESTLAIWPFRFRITFVYELRDGTFAIRQRYENLDAKPMPISPGLHPYFRVDDWHKHDARVITSAREAFDNRTGQQVALTGPIDLGAGEVDLQLLDHGQPEISLRRPDARTVRLSYRDPTTVIAVWTLPSRGFVCIEPWARRADALNRGEAIWVPSGGTHESVLEISSEP